MKTCTLGAPGPAPATMTLAPAFAVLLAFTGCSSSGGGDTGGFVKGPADTHCGAKVQPTSQASCHLTSDAGAGAGGMGSSYGSTLDNAEADDDDCKYHVKWTATPIAQGQDVTFTLVTATKSDGKPAVGAAPAGYSMAEVFLNDTHPAPNTDQKAPESPVGTYAVGPVRFDAPGKWTVRFHLFENCTDLAPDSPHGHAAFYVQVP